MPTRFITLSDCPFCLCSHIKRKVGFEEESAAYLCGHEKFLKDSKLCLKVTWWPDAPRPHSLLLAR